MSIGVATANRQSLAGGCSQRRCGMEPLEKLKLRKSEAREELLKLCGAAEVDEDGEKRIDALTTELAGIERRERALAKYGKTKTPEEVEEREVEERGKALDSQEKERLELRGKAQVSRFLLSRVSGRRLDGPEAEYADACGIRSGDVPLDIFEADRPEEVEKRAVTPRPGTVGLNMAPIQPYVFDGSLAGSLGIDMPSVKSGTFAQSRITAPLSAEAKAKGSDADATAATFGTVSTTPHRVSARLEFLMEDVAEAGVSNFESALRENLRAALADELDNQFVNGDGQAPNITGFLKALGAPAAQGAELSFANGIGAAAALVDGKWATDLPGVRQIVGVDTYQKASALLSGANGDVSLAAYLAAKTGGYRTHSRMPAKASAGALNKNQVGIAFRGSKGLRTAVCPHWGRLSITDIYTGSARGETSVTFHVLIGDVLLLQPDAYQAVAYQVDA